MKLLKRCAWPTPNDKLYIKYHDEEWGVPIYNDKKIYEFLVLEAFQAGLSWRTILHKREGFRKAFANFNFNKVAQFNSRDIKNLLKNSDIIRNKLKIESAVENARRFIDIRKEFGTFSKYMWSWVGKKPIKNNIHSIKDYKPYNKIATLWAKDLKKRGFKFLGPTVLYAHMQAVGMVNDHMKNCFRNR
ncbi:MAG TPA: DNA-3-methyladenine glycosylase I [Candidatus Paceibacterota bacterium]